ncbi:MAG TPA: antibiotic biosynthesis monooxygenase [Acidimicrobiales bacterium]|nr:antibiotic biosynthesis monooxygenase [Acidimicrobiales bacterium]
MYARLVRFSLGPGSETTARELADELAPLISVQPGCQDVTVFGDHGAGEYGIYVLWDTQEHADTAAGVVRPRLNEHLAGKVSAPPETRLFEVLWSK